MKNNRVNEIQTRLRDIEAEKTKLVEELAALQCNNSDLPTIKGITASEKSAETTHGKIVLFLKLFRCRDDVYPKLWENSKKGTKGYSPVCKNEWKKEICRKPMAKCTNCDNKNFAIFDEEAANLHLQGKITIGTYSIRPDDTCVFLTADFDKTVI